MIGGTQAEAVSAAGVQMHFRRYLGFLQNLVENGLWPTSDPNGRFEAVADVRLHLKALKANYEICGLPTVYHPNPVDLWRWTGAGLERLFSENGEWGSVTVSAGSGTASSLAMLNAIYLEHVLRRTPLRPLRGALVSALNRAARALDRRVGLLRDERPGTLAANYHVVAERA